MSTVSKLPGLQHLVLRAWMGEERSKGKGESGCLSVTK